MNQSSEQAVFQCKQALKRILNHSETKCYDNAFLRWIRLYQQYSDALKLDSGSIAGYDAAPVQYFLLPERDSQTIRDTILLGLDNAMSKKQTNTSLEFVKGIYEHQQLADSIILQVESGSILSKF